jgi:hypothetical protein
MLAMVIDGFNTCFRIDENFPIAHKKGRFLMKTAFAK